MSEYTIENKYRIIQSGRTLPPEGALAGLNDMLTEVEACLQCEIESRRAPASADPDQLVALSKTAKEKLNNSQEVLRAIRAYPIDQSREDVLAIGAAVDSLREAAIQSHRVLRKRTIKALAEEAGI